jgi:hypothetical protein
MSDPKNMSQTCCTSCGSHELEDVLRPYCSVVCRTLGRFGLGWRADPYRIVVGSHPHLVVQAGPSFDLRESALKGARQRALATERKRRQRAAVRLPDVTPMAQSTAAKRGSIGILGVGNRQGAESYGN